MSDNISFYVAGVPVPEGSTRAFVVKGKPRIVHQGAKSLDAWRQRIATEAQRARPEQWPNDATSSYDVTVSFLLSRPESVRWWKRIRPTVKPDIDKTGRAVLDALTGILWPDDCQVCLLTIEKDYADNHDDPPGAYIEVSGHDNTAPRPLRRGAK
jgi:Holliday junction resolvase RusA-like endonuclease